MGVPVSAHGRDGYSASRRNGKNEQSHQDPVNGGSDAGAAGAKTGGDSRSGGNAETAAVAPGVGDVYGIDIKRLWYVHVRHRSSMSGVPTEDHESMEAGGKVATVSRRGVDAARHVGGRGARGGAPAL